MYRKNAGGVSLMEETFIYGKNALIEALEA